MTNLKGLALAVPLALAATFNSAAAQDNKAYLERLEFYEERYGEPTTLYRYHLDGSRDERQIYMTSPTEGTSVEYNPEQFGNYDWYDGHLTRYGLENDEFFSYGQKDMVSVRYEDATVCTSDNLTSMRVDFDMTVSANDLSDKEISNKEFSAIYKQVFFDALREQASLAEQSFISHDNGERTNHLVTAFDQALVITRDRIETQYAITVDDREPIHSISTSTTDFLGTVTLNGAELPFRIPNPRCAP